MNTTYIRLVNIFKTFSDNHLQVERFHADFLEQIQNFTHLDTSFPILYAVPINVNLLTSEFTDLSTYSFDLYCLDTIQEGRENITPILNNTAQILNDLHKWIKRNEFTGIDILDISNLTPVNNYTMDKLAGWRMNITFECEGYTYCEIPFEDGTPVPEDDSTNTYIQTGYISNYFV
jgi:hypothetical protein